MRPTLTLLGKPDCHLCDEMHELAVRVLGDREVSLVKRDVRDDRETERQYRFEIPLLFLGEVEVARHRVTEAELRERLARLGLPE